MRAILIMLVIVVLYSATIASTVFLPQTVEGDMALSRRLFGGRTAKPTRCGKGWVAVYTGSVGDPAGQAAGCRLIGDLVCHPSRFDRSRRDPLQVDGRVDGAYTTLLANGEAIVHNPGDGPVTAVVAGRKLALPAHSLRSVLVR